MNLPPVERLTCSLVDIPSVSGAEQDYVLHLEQLFASGGWQVDRQPVAGDRCNLYVRRPGRTPRILFCTHTDTVPPFFPSRVEANAAGAVIRGRGACDTKGVLAAMIHAGQRLLAGGYEDLGYLLLVGEEVDHCGAIAARALGLTPDYCIVGEPTEGKLATGQKGMLKIELRAAGRAGHSAYPEAGVSALHPLVHALHALLAHAWPSHAELGATDLNVGLLQGGVAANVFAPEATATVMLRLACSLARAREVIADVVAATRATTTATLTVTEITANEPVMFAQVPGFDTAPVAFNTDIPYLGYPRNLLMGPGSIRVAHSADEHIAVAELQAAVTTYERLVLALG